MIVQWWRNRRRRRLLAAPAPAGWAEILRDNVWQFWHLSPESQRRLLDITRVLIGEKFWEGCGGLKLTDEIRVTIAGQAGLMLLGWANRYFDQLRTVLVYPDTYVVPEKKQLPGGIVEESYGVRLGEAWQRGPVILSWENVNRGDHASGRDGNVIIHEFAHILDTASDTFNGTPPLDSSEQYRTWRDVMTSEFRRLQKAAQHAVPTLLDQYGTQNEAEFFAVAVECFFEQPAALAAEHSRLYNLLSDYFGQDPQSWESV